MVRLTRTVARSKMEAKSADLRLVKQVSLDLVKQVSLENLQGARECLINSQRGRVEHELN
jgi:hypothetical protein